MLVVFAVVALVLVLVIAAVVIGRESARLAAEAPRPVFDLDEAMSWVADQVPFEVAAELSHDDVRRILGWNLADLQAAAAAGSEGSQGQKSSLPPSPLTVIGEAEALAGVRARAQAVGLAYTNEQVGAVLGAHLAYLQTIGALGPAGFEDVPTEGPRQRGEENEDVAGNAAAGGDTMSEPEKGGGPAEQTL